MLQPGREEELKGRMGGGGGGGLCLAEVLGGSRKEGRREEGRDTGRDAEGEGC